MGSILFAFPDCPSGFVKEGSSCYYHEPAHKTYQQAQDSCAANGAHLARPNNAAENSFLVNLSGWKNAQALGYK